LSFLQAAGRLLGGVVAGWLGLAFGVRKMATRDSHETAGLAVVFLSMLGYALIIPTLPQ
jgi:hypothetical protein